jgi:hypothetical protein
MIPEPPQHSILRSVSLFDLGPFLRPDLPLRRDTARSRRQGWPSLAGFGNVGVWRPRLDGGEHGVTLVEVGSRISADLKVPWPVMGAGPGGQPQCRQRGHWDVGFRGKTGKHVLNQSITAFDPQPT